MGSFYQTCSLSNIPIITGKEAIAFHGVPGSGSFYNYETLPVVGNMDSYGRCESKAYELEAYQKPMMDDIDISAYPTIMRQGIEEPEFEHYIRAIQRGEARLDYDREKARIFQCFILREALDTISSREEAEEEAARMISALGHSSMAIYVMRGFMAGTDIQEKQIKGLFEAGEHDVLQECLAAQCQVINFLNRHDVQMTIHPSCYATEQFDTDEHVQVMAKFLDVAKSVIAEHLKRSDLF